VKDELARAIGVLQPRIPSARWVPKENLHLTLAFLGAVEDGRVPQVSAAISDAVAGRAGFAVRLEGLGAFPSVRRARVLWAGLEDPTRGLAGLADSVAAALEAVGFPREARAFAGHVTLARLKTPGTVVLDEPLSPLAFSVGRIGLFSSRLGRPHAVYEERAMFPFGS
jgi:RNA 2',3'-cyclic 3'-phosphodiesterase